MAIKNASHPLSDGSLAIAIKEYGTIDICVLEGKIECVKTDRPAQVEWEPSVATRVIFGHLPSTWVTDIPEMARPFINEWFPLPLCWLPQNYV